MKMVSFHCRKPSTKNDVGLNVSRHFLFSYFKKSNNNRKVMEQFLFFGEKRMEIFLVKMFVYSIFSDKNRLRDLCRLPILNSGKDKF